jgi:hypothetical protein
MLTHWCFPLTAALLAAVLQAQHALDSLAGVLHQLPEYHTSKANPLATQQQTAAAAGDAAADASSSSSKDASGGDGGISRPQSPELCAKAQRAHDLNSHLTTGSLEPVPGQGDAEEERLKKSRALLAAALAEECRKQQQAEQLEQQLLKEYPHGLPVS